MKRSRTTIIGIACGLACAACVFAYAQGVRGEADAARAEALARYGGEQLEVCVAKRDIAAGESVDASAVETRLWVADLLPAEAFRSSDDVVGKKASSTILAGEVLSERRFRDAGSRLDVPEGLTALSVPAKDVQAVGGAVAGGRLRHRRHVDRCAGERRAGVGDQRKRAGVDNRREGVVDHCGRRARVGAGDRRGGAEDGAVLHVAGKRGRAMSGSLVALCADTTSLQHPESIGLAGENLAAQDWLRIFSSAEEARRFLRTDRLVDEVWVASSDDVAPINLAATLKRDRSDRCVCMLSFEDTGSLKSRMSATGIDASLTRQALAERYARRKQAFACPWPMAAPAAPRQAPMPAAMPVSVAPATAPQPARCDERRPGARAGFLFPVVSGSGGAGKSTVSVLSALIAQRMGYNTLLLDFDLQFGDAPALMGVQNPLAVDDVLAVPSRLDQLRSDGRMPALLAAPRHLEDSEAVVERAPQLLDQLTARFDVVVANTGAAWAEQHALLLERSSKALFLIDQRPSSLRACQHALDLCARCGIATGPFLYAVNRCSKNALFTSIDVSCSLRGAHVFELKDGGGEVEELLGAGLPFDLLASRNDLCASLERVLSGVLPGDRRAAAPPEEGASRGPGFRLPVGKKPRRRRKEAPCL